MHQPQVHRTAIQEGLHKTCGSTHPACALRSSQSLSICMERRHSRAGIHTYTLYIFIVIPPTWHVLATLHAPHQVKLSIAKGLVERICVGERATCSSSTRLSSKLEQVSAGGRHSACMGKPQNERTEVGARKGAAGAAGQPAPGNVLAQCLPPTWNDTRSPIPAACVIAFARAACRSAAMAAAGKVGAAPRWSTC